MVFLKNKGESDPQKTLPLYCTNANQLAAIVWAFLKQKIKCRNAW